MTLLFNTPAASQFQWPTVAYNRGHDKLFALNTKTKELQGEFMDASFHSLVKFAELPFAGIVPLRIQRNCWDCLADNSQFLGIARAMCIDRDK